MVSAAAQREDGHRRRRLSAKERRAQIIRGGVEVPADEGYRGASLHPEADASAYADALVDLLLAAIHRREHPR